MDLLIAAAGEGPSGGGYVTELIGHMPFVFAVAPTHPLAALQRPLGKSDLVAHRAIVVADTARRLPTRTVGLLAGQNTLTVPDIQSKFAFQLAGLGVGFLPECWARPAINSGKLIEKEVDEPRAAEDFYMAWRTGEQGGALRWWIEHLRQADLFARLFQEHSSTTSSNRLAQ